MDSIIMPWWAEPQGHAVVVMCLSVCVPVCVCVCVSIHLYVFYVHFSAAAED